MAKKKKNPFKSSCLGKGTVLQFQQDHHPEDSAAMKGDQIRS